MLRPTYNPKTSRPVGRFYTFIGNLAPPCPILAIYSPKSQKEDTTHGHVLFVFCVDKKDQVLARNETAAQRRYQTASPAQRVAVGKKEQGSERMTSFLPQAQKDVGSKSALLRRGRGRQFESRMPLGLSGQFLPKLQHICIVQVSYNQ